MGKASWRSGTTWDRPYCPISAGQRRARKAYHKQLTLHRRRKEERKRKVEVNEHMDLEDGLQITDFLMDKTLGTGTFGREQKKMEQKKSTSTSCVRKTPQVVKKSAGKQIHREVVKKSAGKRIRPNEESTTPKKMTAFKRSTKKKVSPSSPPPLKAKKSRVSPVMEQKNTHPPPVMKKKRLSKAATIPTIPIIDKKKKDKTATAPTERKKRKTKEEKKHGRKGSKMTAEGSSWNNRGLTSMQSRKKPNVSSGGVTTTTTSALFPSPNSVKRIRGDGPGSRGAKKEKWSSAFADFSEGTSTTTNLPSSSASRKMNLPSSTASHNMRRKKDTGSPHKKRSFAKLCEYPQYPLEWNEGEIVKHDEIYFPQEEYQEPVLGRRKKITTTTTTTTTTSTESSSDEVISLPVRSEESSSASSAASSSSLSQLKLPIEAIDRMWGSMESSPSPSSPTSPLYEREGEALEVTFSSNRSREQRLQSERGIFRSHVVRGPKKQLPRVGFKEESTMAAFSRLQPPTEILSSGHGGIVKTKLHDGYPNRGVWWSSRPGEQDLSCLRYGLYQQEMNYGDHVLVQALGGLPEALGRQENHFFLYRDELLNRDELLGQGVDYDMAMDEMSGDDSSPSDSLSGGERMPRPILSHTPLDWPEDDDDDYEDTDDDLTTIGLSAGSTIMQFANLSHGFTQMWNSLFNWSL